MKRLKKEKFFILLPDGIGLRNFAYTSFNKHAENSKVDFVFWNATPFDLKQMGYSELKMPNPVLHKLTEVYKNTRKNIELQLNINRSNNSVYNSYKFLSSNKTLNSLIKNTLEKGITWFNMSEKGLSRVRKKIIKLEKSTSYYKQCLDILKKEKPSVLFCTNQRPSVAIAPIEAAKELNIPTVSFIFSWDNLPKATVVIETDFYFVWSDHMKKELLYYYPYLKNEQVFVTGTPQFEGHFSEEFYMSKEAFFKEYNLDLSKNYICFSGDDVTTSPNDPYYLRDTAQAVRLLNDNGYNLGIIFRRCPVDFSGRYDFVLNEFKEIIVSLNPVWEQAGTMWNAIMPKKEDTRLLVNTARYSELVINVGSSMVFDFACHNKPCAFINYDTDKRSHPTWNIEHIYNYIHFQSMPNKKAVRWLNRKEDLTQIIESTIDKKDEETIVHALDWFKVLASNPKTAGTSIWKELTKIASNRL